jgi:nucleotide-binding universal stress UspA family protein
MITIANILSPVDFSDFSRHALAHAVQIARWFGSTVTAYYVYPPPSVAPPVIFGGLPGPMPPGEPYPALTVSPEEFHRDVLAQLATFASDVDASGITLKLDAKSGRVVSTIVGEATRLRADLIVLGTHGHGGFDRLMLGSVTEKVLRKASCPVLTVPPQVADVPRDPLQLFKRILCAVDFSDASMKGLEYALALAKEADAELVLLHVIEGVPDAPHWQQPPGPAVVEYLRLAEDESLRRLREALPQNVREWCQPHVILASGKPYVEILRTARERDAHLIVMGVHGRNPIDLAFFGSTTNHVIRSAPCAVLTLRG